MMKIESGPPTTNRSKNTMERTVEIFKVSFIGAFMTILFMVFSFLIGVIIHRYISFAAILVLWVLCFAAVGAWEAKVLQSILEVLISDTLTALLIIAGIVGLLMINTYLRAGSTFDALGGLSAYLLFGPPVLILSIGIGSIAKI